MPPIRAIIAASTTSIAVTALGPSTASAHAHPSAPKDIVQTATAAAKFKTLTALLKKAGLARTLKGKGPYTVFAPTDRAFAKVPKATLNGQRLRVRVRAGKVLIGRARLVTPDVHASNGVIHVINRVLLPGW